MFLLRGWLRLSVVKSRTDAIAALGTPLQGGRVEGHRQRDGERGALPLDTFHRDLPAVGRHNLLDKVEPQARAPGFGRIQGLENLGERGGGDPLPRIGVAVQSVQTVTVSSSFKINILEGVL